MINPPTKFESTGNVPNNLVILIVPCFNEEARWTSKYWESIVIIPDLRLHFVNDGSLDETSSKIMPLLENSQCTLLELPKNLGKAEAIRFGFQHASEFTPLGIGFLDADGAFPLEDVRAQINVFRRLNAIGQVPISVWSSRVQLAGRNIERKLLRHYIARILVTFMAVRLKFKIYDTQSGMKIFPFTPTLLNCVEKRFRTRWFIDLELFLRWRLETKQDMVVWEEPLLAWRDIEGSKVSGKQYLTILNDLRKLNSYKVKH